MKAVLRFIREIFYGREDVTPVPQTPESPPVETFCRGNRYTEWLEGMWVDMKAIKADLVEIKCPDDDSLYRAVLGRGFDENVVGHSVFYSTKTLLPISVAELFRKGVEYGNYYSTTRPDFDDRPSHERPTSNNAEAKRDPREHSCLPRFTNRVEYELRSNHRHLIQMYHRHHFPGNQKAMSKLGERYQRRWELASEWNDHKSIYLGMWGENYLCLKPACADAMFYVGRGGVWEVEFLVVDRETGKTIETFTRPSFVVKPYLQNREVFELYDPVSKSIGLIFDPIRVRALADDEEHGMEAYVALLPGKQKNTFTRQRYRVEVSSELLFANTICKLSHLYKGVAKRLSLETALDNGKMYVDNFHYMCLDGTEHSPDPAGFASIGAEPFFDRREQVYRHTSTIVYYSGPFLITNQDFPIEPVY